MLLVADAGPGGLGALIFVVFIVAAIAIFVAMSRSMKRMRSHVDRGDFGASDPTASQPAALDPDAPESGRSTDPRPGG